MNNDNTNGESHTTEKMNPNDISIKGAIATPEVQAALKKYLKDIEYVTAKKVYKAYDQKETNMKIQRVEGLCGTTLENSFPINFTLTGTEIDPVKSINKKFRLVDYDFALVANMENGKFKGYSATGLKILVTKIEEVGVQNA